MMLPVPSSVFDLNTGTCVAGRREPERTMRRAVTRVTVFWAASYCPRLQPHVPRSQPAGGFLPPGRVPAPPPVHRRQKRRQRAEHGGACQGPLYSSPKPQNGVPGCPRAHALPPSGRQGIVRYTALTTARENARPSLQGPGISRGRGNRRHASLLGSAAVSLRRVPHGRAVCEKALVRRSPTISTKGVLCDALRHYAL